MAALESHSFLRTPYVRRGPLQSSWQQLLILSVGLLQVLELRKEGEGNSFKREEEEEALLFSVAHLYFLTVISLGTSILMVMLLHSIGVMVCLLSGMFLMSTMVKDAALTFLGLLKILYIEILKHLLTLSLHLTSPVSFEKILLLPFYRQ